MDYFQVKQLKHATESQIREIADFCVDAYHGDYAAKAMLGGDWSLHREREEAALRASLLEGYVLIVTIGKKEDEKIVSAGYWFGNGASLFGSEAQRALGYNAFFEKLSEETKIWMRTTVCVDLQFKEPFMQLRAIQYPEIMTKLDQNQFTKEEIEKRWWCYSLATRPEYQGRGYATAIVDAVFKKVTEESSFLGLATAPEENVPKYLAMGFKHKGKGLLPSPTGDFDVHFFSKGNLP